MTPMTPRYWEWYEELEYEFELNNDVEQRIRQLVAEHGIDDDLPSDWEVADLTLRESSHSTERKREYSN